MAVDAKVVGFCNDMSAALDKLILDKKLPALKINTKIMPPVVNQE